MCYIGSEPGLQEPKMSARVFRYFCASALSFAYMGISAAQSPAAHARFAIEIPGFNGPFPYYLTVPEAEPGTMSPSSSPCTTFAFDHSLVRLANTGAGAEKPSAFRLEICVKEDTLFITPTVDYGGFDQQNQPASKEKLRSETLATHSGKLNDAVAFTEMEQLGLEPLTLRIVTAQSDSPYNPLTHSDAPSVQIEFTPVDREHGTLTLTNLSNKAVDAFRIENFQAAGAEEESSLGSYKSNGWPSVIAPGASHQIPIGVPHSGKSVNGRFVEDPTPQYTVLQSVLFADGSYEGDSQTTAEMAARVFGAQVQHSRIERLVEPILADDDLDDAAKIERIRTANQQLSTNPDSEAVAQFHAQYPAFSEEELTEAEPNIGQAMKSEIETMDHLIQQNEPILQQNRARLTLAQWWKTVTESH
jgi:hypothetical protein